MVVAMIRGVGAAFQGALGFLTWVPVGRSEAHWEAFAARPAVIPLVGYVVGALVTIPFFLGLPPEVTGVLYLLGVYLATGINHADGLLDLADGLATHGDADRAIEAMKDSRVGVAGVLSLGVVLIGLYGLGQTLATLPIAAVGLVVAAEVGAKLGMTVVIARGTAAHDGLGKALSGAAGSGTLVRAVLLSIPATLLTWPNPAAALAVAVGGATGIALEWWTDRRLGGVNGDVMGATNEVARLLALGAGVVLWTVLVG